MAHVRTEGDGGEGKKRELGRHTFYEHEASFAFCRGIEALTQHSSTSCHLSCGRSEPGSEKRKRFCAILSGAGHLPYSKDGLRRGALSSVQWSVFFVLGVDYPSTYFPSEQFVHNRYIFSMNPLATFTDTEIRCEKPKKKLMLRSR